MINIADIQARLEEAGMQLNPSVDELVPYESMPVPELLRHLIPHREGLATLILNSGNPSCHKHKEIFTKAGLVCYSEMNYLSHLIMVIGFEES